MKLSSKTLAAALALASPVLWPAPAAAQLAAGEKEAPLAPIAGVVAPGSAWQRIWSGTMNADGMTTSPDGYLLFAQEQSSSIRKLWPSGQEWVAVPYLPGAGAVSVDGEGRMFAVQRTCTDPGLKPAECAVPTSVIQLTPTRKVLADKFADGKPLGRLNDIEADGHGGAFFTQGGIYHVGADGTVSVVAEGGGLFTNGVVLSPDGKTLYVTNRATILAFDVGPDGATSGRRDFVTLSNEGQGFGGDGMAVDSQGRLYVTGDAGVYVIDKGGKELGILPVPRRAITLAFAGPERSTLYVGAMGAVDPGGQPWETPEGVRNTAMTIYTVPVLAKGVR